MKKLHLWWIIPVCFIIGALVGLYSINWFFNTTAWAITEICAVDLAECKNISIDTFDLGFYDEHAEAKAILCQKDHDFDVNTAIKHIIS